MDFMLERWINRPAGTHPPLDVLMVHVAGWAEPLFIALVILWFLLGWLRGLPRDRQGAITALVGAGVALLVNQVILRLWARPRPFIAHPASVHVLLSHRIDPGFPSDHASAGFAIVIVLVAFHRRLGALALLLALLMIYARVYVGVHYPTDVLAGALIGSAVGFVLVTRLEGLMVALRRRVDRLITLLRLPLPT